MHDEILINIFNKEEQVAFQAEELLASDINNSINSENYRSLLEEYKTLLKQMMRVVKLADMTQLELKTMSYRLEAASQTDVLTSLYNRRYFNEAYRKEWKSALRTKTAIAIIMVDIDYFKKYNDTYGHLQGDECIIAIAKEINRVVKRPRDVPARFGGDEFVLLLPATEVKGACYLVQELLENVRELALIHIDSPLHSIVTLSVGVAVVIPDDTITIDSFLNMADSALYTAKKKGRNCFHVFVK